MENLFEAFQELKLLDEDVFTTSPEGIEELKTFADNDVQNDLELVIDPEAETEETLQDSYIGKVILECNICQSKIYKNAEDVVIDEAETLANIGEDCPYCQSTDGYKVIGQVAEYCPDCKEQAETEEGVEVSVEKTDETEIKEGLQNSLKEEIEAITVEAGNETINITSHDEEDETYSAGEMIEPVSSETEAKILSANGDEFEDVDIEEFDEKEFDELGEKYLRNIYENVKTFKTTSGSIKGNTLKLEGLITFKSGKQGKTHFLFEGKTISKTGKLKFIGENKQFARGNKSFTLTGKMRGKKLIAESLTYNYRAKDNNGRAKRIYGTVNKAN